MCVFPGYNVFPLLTLLSLVPFDKYSGYNALPGTTRRRTGFFLRSITVIQLAFLPRASTIMSHRVPDLPKEKFTSAKSLKVFVSIYDRVFLIHDKDLNE